MNRLATMLMATTALALAASPLVAQSDTTFTYQGSLDENDAPANGSFNMEFSLWEDADGGNQVGTTIAIPVQVADGRFLVYLDYGANAFDNSVRWLEIAIEGVTLDPRQPTTRTPYSMQTRGIFVDANKNVGIGTTSPALPLHIQDTVPYVQFDDSDGGSTWIVGVQGPTVGFNITEVGEDYRFVISEGGNVGIGTIFPQYALDVEGDSHAINAHSIGGSGIVGTTENESRFGVLGRSANTGGTGVRGVGFGPESTGVHGHANAFSGANFGVVGYSNSPEGTGVYGTVAANSGVSYGVYGRTNSSSGYDFYAAGAGVDYGSSSSRRWKSDIQAIDHPLERIAKLRGVYFDWDEEHGGQHDVGMIAEEVGKVLPEIVAYEENGVDAHGMDYSKLTPLLVEALNALRAEKDGEIAALTAENIKLRGRLAGLEAAVAALVQESITVEGALN